MTEEVLDYEDVHDDHANIDAVPAETQAEEIGKGTYSGIQASTFKDFLLKEPLLRAIQNAGFEHPSEVQQQCIPPAIQHSDILCQAKSGMGKTAVFVLSTLHELATDKPPTAPKILVLAHTRELASQICSEFKRFSTYFTGINSIYVCGKLPIEDQKQEIQKTNPAIVVGTPGRTLDLIRRHDLDVSQVEYFILDECDQLLKELNMRKTVQDIYLQTPHDKQVMMFSATLPQEIRPLARKFMHNPVEIFVDDETKLTLHGLQQHWVDLPEQDKTPKLIDLLDALDFNQVVVFVRTNDRADALTKILQSVKFPTIGIFGNLRQEERLRLFKEFKDFKARILVTTDLMARGIDIERVNIVFNYDMPSSSDIYLHRVGRAGRFGTKGLAISFITSADDRAILDQIQTRFQTKILPLPDTITVESYMGA